MKCEEQVREEVEKFIRAAYALDNTPEKMLDVYDTWSDTYDETVSQLFDGPRLAAEAAAEVVEEAARATARVLDVAAGTGLVGRELYQRGFRLLDAVEPSKGMMRQLENTGLYTNKFLQFIGLGRESCVPADTYDLVVCSGGFGEAHIPVQGIDDMIRAAKPELYALTPTGGKVVVVMRRQYLDTVEMYRERLEPHLARREAEGYWVKVSRKVTPQYVLKKIEGIIYVYTVLKSLP